MPHVDGSDAALARAWQGGDVRAFDEAYRRFAPALFGTAVGLVGDRSAAGDVVHDTFLRAATRIGGLRDPARLRSWLFAILRNEAASVHRGRSRLGGGLDDGPAPVSEWLADSAPPPDVELSRRELADLVWSAADGLQPRDREVLELHLRGGLEAGDLGLAMGVTAGHAAVLLSRMRDRLERCLGALLIARSGRPGCGELDRLLSGWDGRFSLDVRGKVTRHVEGCRACGQRRGALVSLEHLAPVLVPPMVVLPEELQARLVANLAGLPSSAGALDAPGREWIWREDGFPWPADDGEAASMLGSIADDVPRHSSGPPDRRAALAAIVALLLVGVAVVTAVVRGRPPTSEVATVAESVIATGPGSAPAPEPAALTGALTGAPTASPSIPDVPPSPGSSPSGSVPGSPAPVPTTTPTLAVPTPTPTPTPDPPVILRVALSPTEVQQAGGTQCTRLTSSVTVAVRSATTVTGSVTWRPDGVRSVTTALEPVGGGLTGQLGPVSAAGTASVAVRVVDANGLGDSAKTTLTVIACR